MAWAMSSNDIVEIWLRESESRDFYVFQSNPKENINLLNLYPFVLSSQLKFDFILYFGLQYIQLLIVQI